MLVGLLVGTLLLLTTALQSVAQTNSFVQAGTVGTAGAPENNLTIRVAADFNGDGLNDLAATDLNGTMGLYLNTLGSPGTFSANTGALSALPANVSLDAGDVDNDGDMDLVASDGKVYINNGSAVFTPIAGLTFKRSTTSGGIGALTLADMNGDGKLDIVWVNNSVGPGVFNEIWRNTGTTGNPSFAYSRAFSNTGSGRSSMAVGDIDGDGDRDIVSGQVGSGAEVFKNDGSGTMTLSQVISPFSGTVQLGDWNRDGKIDLLSFDSHNNTGFSVSLNNGTGSFSAYTVIYQSNARGRFVDVNGDGLPDGVLSNGISNAQVLINNGCTLLLQSGTLSNANNGVFPADVTGDQKIDLICAATNAQSTIWRNDLALASAATAPGNALNFDGVNDKVTVANHVSLNFGSPNNFTLEAWVRLNGDQPNYAGIISKASSGSNWYGYQLVIVDQRLAGEIAANGSFVSFQQGLQGTTRLNDGTWHHVAMVVTRSSNNARLYVDGVLEANITNTLIASTINNSAPLLIGCERNSTTFFKGSIDEVRVWQAAKTEAELRAARTGVVNGCSTATLVGYYVFDNGTPSANNASYYALNDVSTTLNHGLLSGFNLAGTTSNWVESYAMVVPTISAATNVQVNSFTANWSAPVTGQVNDYLLDVSTASNFSTLVPGYAGLSVTGTSANVTGLSGNTIYYYRVRANKTSVNGQGSYSLSANVTTIARLNALGVSSVNGASAYSVRLLNSSYTGSALQVRRSTDNALQNIGFTGAGGLDTLALKAFVADGNGFVVTWYDQTGNGRHLTQATTAKQPAIVNAGTIYRRNLQPTIYFDGTDDGLRNGGSNYLTSNPITISLVAGSNSSSAGARRAIQGNGNNWLLGPYQNIHSWYAVSGFNHQVAPAWSLTEAEIFTVVQPSPGINESYRNGAALTTANFKGVPNKINLGAEGDLTNEPLDGYISEVVSFANILSTQERQNMEASQATYYPSSNAFLSALAISQASLSPVFQPATNTYTASVAPEINSITVTPTASKGSSHIQLRINGGAFTTVVSGNPSSSLALQVGTNTIEVLCTAPDAFTTNTYTITVTREASAIATLSNLVLSTGNLSPAFAEGVTTYTAIVANAATSLTITPQVTQANAKVTVNGIPTQSGAASAAIPLAQGTNTITVVCTALDGTTTTTYTITITRLANNVLYYHSFSTGTPASGNYSTAADVLAPNLAAGTPHWSGVEGTTFCTGNPGISMSVPNLGTSKSFTLNLSVAAGQSLHLSGISFRQVSTINNGGYAVKINGVNYDGMGGSGILNSCPGVQANGTSLRTLTGNVTIEVTATNSGTGTQSFAIDDFSLMGTITSSPGNALHFAGDNDYVNIPDANNLDMTGSYTIECWIKPSAFTEGGGLVSKYNSNASNGYTLRLGFTPPYSSINFDGMQTANGVLQTNQWYHIAAVNNAGTRKVYINGVEQPLTGGTFTTMANTDPLTIGVDYLIGGRYFNGAIDEVRLYSTALTQANIQADMFSAVASVPANLRAYYSFNQGIPAGSNAGVVSLPDMSANGNNGTLTNFTLLATTSNWLASTIYNKWLGAASADFSAGDNWQLAVVPTANDNILIPADAVRLPVTNTGTQSVFNVRVEENASLTNTGTLAITGNVFNSGVITSTGGAIAYSGTVAQRIAANTFANNTVDKLTINNPLGVTLDGALSVTGVYTPSAGFLVTNDLLTLRSTATGTARVAAGSGSYLQGKVTIERYLTDKTARKNIFLASPVSQSIASSWQQQIHITGAGTGGTPCNNTNATTPFQPTTNSNGFDVTQTNAASMYTYNGSNAVGSRWVPLPNTNENLVPGKGYRVIVRGARSQGCLLLTDANADPLPVTLQAQGSMADGVNMGTISVPVISGFSFVGNPYPSPVSFNSFRSSNNAIIGNKYWTYNPANTGGTYSTYDGITAINFPGGADANVLASGQSFFVQSSTGGTVNFSESHKISATGPGLFRPATYTKLIRVGLQTAGNQHLDEVVIRFGDQGSKNYTEAGDALSLNEGSQLIASLKGTERLAIQTRPENFVTDTVQLRVQSSAAGNYQLYFSEYENFDGTGIVLIDKFLQVEHTVNTNPRYTFAVSSNAASQGNDRFELVFRTATVLPVDYITLAAKALTTGVQLSWQVTNQQQVKGYVIERSADGRQFKKIGEVAANTTTASQPLYEWFDGQAPAGKLYYRIKVSSVIGVDKYSPVASAQMQQLTNPSVIYPNPVKDALNIISAAARPGSVRVRIFDNRGVQVLQAAKTSGNNGRIVVNTSHLQQGAYHVELLRADGTSEILSFIK